MKSANGDWAMDDARVYDVLLCEPVQLLERQWKQALIKRMPARAVAHPSGRGAITTFGNASYDAIVCALKLNDIDCWRLISLLRSGRFGFSEIPVFLICPEEQRVALEPMLDPFTVLIDIDPDVALEQIRATLAGRPKSSVLVVEDEPAAAEAAHRGLKKYYDIEIAYDGPSGLAAWKARRHGLIILDLNLPGMSGAQVQEAVLDIDTEQLILILTAQDGIETHQEHILNGAWGFLPKPLVIHQLPSIVAQAFREQRILREAEAARERASAYLALAARVHAAHSTLRRGSTAEAASHLSHAAFTCRATGPTDDQWNELIKEPLQTPYSP